MDRRFARVCLFLAEPNRDKKKRPQPYTLEDFMPQRKARSMTSTQMDKALRQINMILRGDEK